MAPTWAGPGLVLFIFKIMRPLKWCDVSLQTFFCFKSCRGVLIDSNCCTWTETELHLERILVLLVPRTFQNADLPSIQLEASVTVLVNFRH